MATNIFKLQFKNTHLPHHTDDNRLVVDTNGTPNSTIGWGYAEWLTIEESKVIIFYKIANQRFVLFNNEVHEIDTNDFSVEYYIDDAGPTNPTKDSIVVTNASGNQIPSKAQNTSPKRMTGIEYAVISHATGSTWKLIYFNGRYYWVRIA